MLAASTDLVSVDPTLYIKSGQTGHAIDLTLCIESGRAAYFVLAPCPVAPRLCIESGRTLYTKSW